MRSAGPGRESKPIDRVFGIALATVMAAALIGFFTGTREGAYQGPPVDVEAGVGSSRSAVSPAVSYLEQIESGVVPRGGAEADLNKLVAELPSLFDEVETGEGLKQASLRKRAQRRAFRGAPPVIPHAIDQRGSLNCLVCHDKGIRLGGVVAPRVSHTRNPGCTQCHVGADRPLSLATVTGAGEPVFSNFEGLPEAIAGEQAGAGSPPVVPHSTHMRENCSSCHGLAGYPGLRTTHPDRAKCLQCHAPVDQRDGPPPMEWAGD